VPGAALPQLTQTSPFQIVADDAQTLSYRQFAAICGKDGRNVSKILLKVALSECVV